MKVVEISMTQEVLKGVRVDIFNLVVLAVILVGDVAVFMVHLVIIVVDLISRVNYIKKAIDVGRFISFLPATYLGHFKWNRVH